MLKFDSVEHLGQWAQRYRVTAVEVSREGALQGVSFATGPESTGDDLTDTERPPRRENEIEVAARNMMRGFPEGASRA